MFAILPEEELFDSVEEIKCEILYLLMQRPERPMPLQLLAEELAMTPLAVESLLEQMEGPVRGSWQPDALLRFDRSSGRAVYLPQGARAAAP